MTAPLKEPSVASVLGLTEGRTGLLERRPLKVGKFVIKLFTDATPIQAGNNSAGMSLAIPEDLDGCSLVFCGGDIFDAGGSVTRIQIRNITQGNADMLSTRIEIDSGETSSGDSSPQPVVDIANQIVSYKDQLAFDIDNAGSGALGLSVWLIFA